MRFSFLLLIMVINGAMGQTPGRLPIDSLLVVQSDLIVFGQLNYADGNKLSCKLESVFKIQCPPDASILLDMGSNSCDFTVGVSYVVFATTQGCTHFIRGGELVELTDKNRDAISHLLDRLLPCQVPVNLPDNFAGCHRILNPVCGCDGKAYGNSCEARRNGISKFTRGRCR